MPLVTKECSQPQEPEATEGPQVLPSEEDEEEERPPTSSGESEPEGDPAVGDSPHRRFCMPLAAGL